MRVDAPGLFSTITGSPDDSPSFWAIARAWMSVWPLGGNGTTMRTGLPGIGNPCAGAPHANANAQIARAVLIRAVSSRA